MRGPIGKMIAILAIMLGLTLNYAPPSNMDMSPFVMDTTCPQGFVCVITTTDNIQRVIMGHGEAYRALNATFVQGGHHHGH